MTPISIVRRSSHAGRIGLLLTLAVAGLSLASPCAPAALAHSSHVSIVVTTQRTQLWNYFYVTGKGFTHNGLVQNTVLGLAGYPHGYHLGNLRADAHGQFTYEDEINCWYGQGSSVTVVARDVTTGRDTTWQGIVNTQTDAFVCRA